MKDCAGYSKPLVGQLPRPCAYPALWDVNGVPVCFWHERVFLGLITEVTPGKALSWSPHLPKVPDEPEDMLAFLRREWDLAGL